MSTTQSTTVRLAFIGTGGIAKTHANALKCLGDSATVVAAADPNTEALSVFTGQTGAAAHGSAQELIAAISAGTLEADALILCTPPAVRREVIEPALRAGLDVLIEKPLAINTKAGQELVALSEQYPNRVCAIGYCHRFTPAVLKMRELAVNGSLGRVTRFENVFAFHHPPMSERWFSDPAVSGGGAFIDTGCHSLDLFQFLVGPPKVLGEVADRAWAGRGESSATTLVVSEGGQHPGVAGVILAGWLESARFHVRLVGTEGSLFYDYEKPTELLHTLPDGTAKWIEVETHDVRFQRQLQAFIRASKDGLTANQAGMASFADGLVVAKAVDAADHAGRLYN
jgi:predicted dehydrogenase